MANFNPIEIEKVLKGVDFPADKKNILEKARENNASAEVLNHLNNLPEKNFHSPTDITHEIKQSGR